VHSLINRFLQISSNLKSVCSNRINIFVAAVIFIPLLTTLFLVISGLIFQVRSFTWVLFIIGYCLTVLGITVGYHRYLTHKSFTTGRVMSTVLIALGCMAYEGPPSFWVGIHRKHHISPDTAIDPHSPYQEQRLSLRTFLHSHIGWMFNIKLSEWQPYIKDIKRQKVIRFFDRYYVAIAFSGLLIPAAINGWYYHSWEQFVIGFLVCGVFRVFVQHQVTWSINSVCHVWGKSHFQTVDNSKNNSLLGILALGEGWHNGHHAFPRSARHGLLKGQIDISYGFIRFLERLGLATEVREVSRISIIKKLLQKQQELKKGG